MYCAIVNGRPSFGTYLGRANDRYLFRISSFSYDYGVLGNGIEVEMLDQWTLIELPEGCNTEMEAFNYMVQCLPE